MSAMPPTPGPTMIAGRIIQGLTPASAAPVKIAAPIIEPPSQANQRRSSFAATLASKPVFIGESSLAELRASSGCCALVRVVPLAADRPVLCGDILARFRTAHAAARDRALRLDELPEELLERRGGVWAD